MAVSDQVYRNLQRVAEQVGYNNYLRQSEEHTKKGKSPRTFRYNPSEFHRKLIAAMGSHTITDGEAMALLNEYDCDTERWLTPEEKSKYGTQGQKR